MAGEKNNPVSGQDVNQLAQVRRDKLAELQRSGKDPFAIVRYEQTHHSAEILSAFDALEGQTVSVAGRMMSKRVMGKASFIHIKDLQGQIQCYVTRDDLGEEAYAAFKKLDIGDIVASAASCSKRKWARSRSTRASSLC